MRPGFIFAILVALLCALAGARLAQGEEERAPRIPPALGARILL